MISSLLETQDRRTIRSLFERWAPYIEVVREAKNGLNDEKAFQLAMILENTRRQFERLERINEATQTDAVGTFKKYYFDIITSVMPNMVAQDLVSVQPIPQKIAQVFYLKYLYGSDKGKIKAGDKLLDPYNGWAPDHRATGMAPVYNYSSDTIEEEPVFSTPVVGDGTAAVAGNLSYTPVIPGSVAFSVVLEAGASDVTALVVDNGSGVLTCANSAVLASNGTINYASGAYSFVVKNASTLNSGTVTYNYNNEYAPTKVPEITIQVAEATMQAKSRKLKALYAFDASFDLKAQHGIDIDETLLTAVTGEILHELDGEICADLYRQAALTSTWDRTPPNTQIPWAVHRETLIDEFIAASNSIFTVTQRAVGNFIVCGVNVSNVLESIGAPRFVAAGGSSPTGPHFAGTLDGRWRVYKNPYYGANEYLVGYKGDLFLDAGYVYAPYLPVFSTQLIMDETFLGRRGFATSNAKKMLNPNIYVKGSIFASPVV